MEYTILQALSFGEHCGLKGIKVKDLESMNICLKAAIDDFNSATESQMANEECYQYFSAWCRDKLTQEFCDDALIVRMTKTELIEQLESLIDNARDYCKDSDHDDVWDKDIECCELCIKLVERYVDNNGKIKGE